MEYLPAIILYLEVFLLAFAERRLWKTWFTPLNCLAVPYALVLTVCLFLNGNSSFVPFYFPSIWVWIVGLLVFFIPSLAIALCRSDRSLEMPSFSAFTIPPKTLRILEWMNRIGLALFFFWFIYLCFFKHLMPGSETFAHAWAMHGFFGHLYTLLMILVILWIFLIDKKHKRFGFYIAGFVIIGFLYLVKCWLMIPLLGGLLLRLLCKKTRLRLWLAASVVVGGFALFFGVYWSVMYVHRVDEAVEARNISRPAYRAEVANYIKQHFLTYTSAGVYGLSEDMAQGVTEDREAAKVYTGFINIGKLFGDREYENCINPHYLSITPYDIGTNVRTFMGTLYVFLGPWHAAAYVLVISALIYLLFYRVLKRKSVFSLVLLGWVAGCLLVGWFDLYAQHLEFITIPCFLAAIAIFCHWAEQGFKRPRIPQRFNPCCLFKKYRRILRKILAWLQNVALALLLLFFWTPFHIPVYLMGVCAGIAFAFVWMVPRRAIGFRYLRPYLPLLILFLLFLVSLVYADYPQHALKYIFSQLTLVLVPFIFWGMGAKFFSPKKLQMLALCFVVGCVLELIVKYSILAYCFDLLKPFFHVVYTEQGITYMATGSSMLFSLNEFISFQGVYLSWMHLKPIMHTSVEAIYINMALMLVWVARIKNQTLLHSRARRIVADLLLLFFGVSMLFTTSKIGQILFVFNILFCVVYTFYKKRYILAGSVTALLLVLSVLGFHYFGLSFSTKFKRAMTVFSELKEENKAVEDDGSLLPRVQCWQTAVKMIKQRPVLGYGASSKKSFTRQFAADHPDAEIVYRHPHNQFLDIMTSLGIPGLLLFLWFWVEAGRLVWKNRKLWALVWFWGLFLFCCVDIVFFSISQVFLICLPYCFLMAEYHNKKSLSQQPAEELQNNP